MKNKRRRDDDVMEFHLDCVSAARKCPQWNSGHKDYIWYDEWMVRNGVGYEVEKTILFWCRQRVL